MQRFQLAEKVWAGDIDHIVVLPQHLPGNGKGGMGLAQPCVTHQQQTFAGSGGEVRGVIPQVSQNLGHVAAHALAQRLVHRVGVVVQLHGVKAGDRQAGQFLDLLPAQLLHHPAHTVAGAAVHCAGVLAPLAGELRLQRIRRAPAPGQQGGQLLLCRRKGSSSLGTVLAGSSGNGAADAPYPHFLLGVAQPGNGGFGFGLCILCQGAGGLPPHGHGAQCLLIQFVFGTHKGSLLRFLDQGTAAGGVFQDIVSAGCVAVYPDIPACSGCGHRAAHIVDAAQPLGVPCFKDAVPVP